jgi:hypothetical protein
MELKNEIPARAFINAQIIMELRDKDIFIESINKVINYPQYKDHLSQIGYQFENQAYIVSLLYCLIVVPKESWDNSAIYDKLASEKPQDLFTLTMDDSHLPRIQKDYSNVEKKLIYRLRNSVSHANYSINDTLEFTFWDMIPNNPKEWEVKIKSNNLMIFLSKVGSILANEGLILNNLNK